MRKQFLVSLLSFCLLAGLLPSMAVSAEEGKEEDAVITCTQVQNCQAKEHEEGCSMYENTNEEHGGAESIGTEEEKEDSILVTPADDLTQMEQSEKETEYKQNAESVEIVITEADMQNVSEEQTAVAAAVVRLGIEDMSAVTSLRVVTEGTAYLSPEDNMYIKENFTALSYLDESESKCSTRNLAESYLEKSGLEDIAYEEFGGLSGFATLKTLLMPNSAQVINSYTLGERGGGLNGTGLTTVTIPNSVLLIESGAFESLNSFTGDLVIPDSVICIGNNAFGIGNTGVMCGTLTLGNSLKYIDANAFKSRLFTGNLVIPDSVETVDNWAFTSGAFEGGTWTLGSGLTQIGSASLSGICSGNTGTLTILNKWNMASSAFRNNTFSKIVFEEGITDISTGLLVASSKNVTEIVLPSTLTTISGAAVFEGCTALTTVDFPEGLEILADRSFSNDTALANVILPSTLTEIGLSAFEGSGAVGVFIPTRVEHIDGRAFMDISEGSVIYMQSDDCYEEMNLEQSWDGWNRRYDDADTALALTNGGTFAKDTEFTAGTLATPVRDGAIFKGWYENSDFSGDAVTKAEPGKTYYAKWIGMDDMKLQYGGEKKITSSAEISDLAGYQSSDTSVAVVDGEGNVTAAGVGTAVISATGIYEGQQMTFKAVVTVTPRMLTYYNKDSKPQENPGSVTYAVSDEHQNINDLLTFKWKDSPNTEVTLADGVDLDYTYTVPEDNGGLGEEVTVDFLPMPKGEYTVRFNLRNPNYVFASSSPDGGSLDSITLTANVTGENVERAYIAEVESTGNSFTYDGTGKLPVTGTLTAYKADAPGSEIVDVGSFSLYIEGLNDTVFHSQVQNIKSGTSLSDIADLELPNMPGVYLITVSAANGSYYIYKSQVFTIEKATVTIKPNDRTAYVGDEVPVLGENDYTVTGLAKKDNLAAAPVLAYENTPDMTAAGTYAITAEGAVVPNTECYEETIIYEPGALTITQRSEGEGESGNGDSGSEDISGDSDSSTENDKNENTKSEQAVKTGDNSNGSMWALLSGASLVVCGMLLKRKRIK